MAQIDVTQTVVDELGKPVEGGQLKQLLSTAVLATPAAAESKVEHFDLWFKLKIHDITQPVVDFTEKELGLLKKAVVAVYSTFAAGQLHYMLSGDAKKIEAVVADVKKDL